MEVRINVEGVSAKNERSLKVEGGINVEIGIF
jgi:hypothetical protein